MIISGGRNFIFVHIPKTGGTSLALALEGRAMKDDIMMGDTPKARKRRKRVQGIPTRGRLWKHSTLSDVDGLVGIKQIQKAFIFTLVRNPWDRMVSYYHWLKTQRFDHPAVHLAQAREFSGFVNATEIQRALRAAPYSHYVQAVDNQEYCNAFIRLEHFDEDAASLWAHLGFELERPHVNSSERGASYQDYYSDADRALVGKICEQDIARFGYSYC